MDEAVAGEELFAVDIEWLVFEIRDASAGFGDEERAGGDVPGAKTVFPESIETSTRHISQIERR
jgi:hypothetical protein